MGTTVARVEAALDREGLRGEVDAIDAHDGEVVLWCGGGHPVSSVREAIAYCRQLRDSEEARIAREQDEQDRLAE